MPRYIQMMNQAGEYELIEVEDRPRGVPRLQIMGGKVHENYRSPVDGSIITSGRQEKEHMRKHDVVRPGDFGANEGKEHFARAQKERDDFHSGTSQKHQREVRKDVKETVEKLKQGLTPAKPRNPGEL